MSTFSEIKLPDEWKDWELTDEIGSGSFGTVYRAVNRVSGQECAIKIIEIPKDGLIPRNIIAEIEEKLKGEASDQNDSGNHEKKRAKLKEKSMGMAGEEEASDLPSGLKGAELLKEIRRREEEEEKKKDQMDTEVQSYLRSLVEECQTILETMASLGENPHILKIHDSIIQEHTEGVGFDIFIRTDLLTSSKDRLVAGELTEMEIIKLGLDICDALTDCEKAGFIHWDIKPENILMTEDGEYVLSDFGLSRILKKTVTSLGSSGTLRYTAPEIYNGGKCYPNVDLYSLGSLMYVLENKDKEPFLDMKKPILYFQDRDKAFRKRMEGSEPVPEPVEGSKGLKNIILRLCAFDPRRRYQKAEQLKEDLLQLKDNRYVPRNVKTNGGRRKKASSGPMKKIAGLALACLILAGAYLGWYHSFRKVINKESCGEGLYCTLDGSGHLTIEGQGSPDPKEYPWKDYTDKVKNVSIKDGVTEVADGMFQNCSNLCRVHLEDSVTRIGKDSFSGCSSLAEVELPKSLEYIKPGAFASTPWMDSQEQPYIILDDVLLYYDAAKGGQEAVIPENTEKIAAYAFADNEGLTSIILPSDLQSIDQEAFSGCPNLENIDFSGNTNISRADFRKIARDTVWYLDNYGPASLAKDFVNNLRSLCESGHQEMLAAHYSKQLSGYHPGEIGDYTSGIKEINPDSFQLQVTDQGGRYFLYNCGTENEAKDNIVVFKEYGAWVYAFQRDFDKYLNRLLIDDLNK